MEETALLAQNGAVHGIKRRNQRRINQIGRGTGIAQQGESKIPCRILIDVQINDLAIHGEGGVVKVHVHVLGLGRKRKGKGREGGM